MTELEQRLGEVIRNTCNTVGCNDCDLKWDGGCSATDLQDRIYAEQLPQAPVEKGED